ncbi:MAG: hypothetical protein MI745_06405 [Pseudomonadales bacterium]|nr:hypothetical protein [Pseudomonadales bacterium]
MKFLVLIVVLGLRRLDISWPHWLVDGQRHRAWLKQWGNRTGAGQWLWWLAVALPAGVFMVLECWLGGFWGQLVLLALGIALMLWLVGGQSEFRHVDELLVRGRMNDPDGFAALAQDEFAVTGTPGQGDYHQALSQTILEREQQLFVAIFWLVVLGPGAAFLVVLNRAWLNLAQQDAGWQTTLDQLLCWPGRKLLVLSMALAGDFTAVMDKMRGQWANPDQQGEQLLAVVKVALEDVQMSDGAFPSALDELESMQGLLLRCVAIWLILAAIWIIVA